MKKIGIITYPDIADGKGRFLQAYSLYSFIQMCGYDVEIIDYIGHIDESKMERFTRHLKMLSPQLVMKIIHEKRERNIMSQIDDSRKEQRNLYANFISEHIKMSKRFTKFEDLVGDSKKFDAIVCGSDQIWNPYYWGKDSAYYARFVDAKKRISYAPSIGTDKIDDENLEYISKFIKEMKYVSTREESAAKMLWNKAGINSVVVTDPTFLMKNEWWDNFAGERLNKNPYILTFFFDNSSICRTFSNRICYEKNVEIINIPQTSMDIKNESKMWSCLGPREFVSAFKYADYIITQSFHGVVLSIIFQKKFFVLDRSNGYAVSGLMARITDLLNRVGLINRVIDGTEDIEKIDSDIDYSEVYKKLNVHRDASRKYLLSALQEVLNDKAE